MWAKEFDTPKASYLVNEQSYELIQMESAHISGSLAVRNGGFEEVSVTLFNITKLIGQKYKLQMNYPEAEPSGYQNKRS